MREPDFLKRRDWKGYRLRVRIWDDGQASYLNEGVSVINIFSPPQVTAVSDRRECELYVWSVHRTGTILLGYPTASARSSCVPNQPWVSSHRICSASLLQRSAAQHAGVLQSCTAEKLSLRGITFLFYLQWTWIQH
jgi:hypothetical protein